MSPLLLAAVLQADPKVTLDLPISPLSAILKEASDQAGVALKASGYDPNRRMFVQVKGMPASRLRQALATATGGKWIQTSQSWQLQLPPPEAAWQEIFREMVRRWSIYREAKQVKDQAAMDAMIRRSLALHKGQLTPAQHREKDALNHQGPREQLLLRTLLALPKDELGSLALGERRVYAVRPNSLQRSLPAGFSRDFQKFLEEDELMQERVAALAPEFKDRSKFGWSSITQYALRQSLREGTVVHLVVKRSRESMDHARAEMILYDRNGERIANWGASITPEVTFEPRSSPKPEVTPFSRLKEPYQFQGEEKQIADVMAQFGREWPGMKKRPVLNAAIKKRYLEMDKLDPLTLTATDVLKLAAKRLSRQLVAETPDRGLLLQAARREPGASLTLEKAATLCFPRPLEGRQLELVEAPDLIVVKAQPRTLQTVNMTVSRSLMAKHLKTASQHTACFETISDLCASVDREGDLDIAERLGMLFGASYYSPSSLHGFEAHSIYGFLSAAQRKAARSGGVTVPLSGLPFKAKWLAYRILTSVDSIPQPSAERLSWLRGAKISSHESDEMAGVSWGMPESLKEEPTQYLAGLAEREVSLKFRVEEGQAIYRLYNDPSSMMGSVLVTPQSAARDVVKAMKTPGASQPEFLCGGQTSLVLMLVMPRGARLTVTPTVKGTELMEASRPYTQLPEPFRSQIAKEVAKLRSQ